VAAKTLIGIHKTMSEQHQRWIPSVSDQIHALLKLNREKKLTKSLASVIQFLLTDALILVFLFSVIFS